MKRTSKLSRRTPLARGTTPMRRGKKRSAAETQRIYGTPERIAWLKAQSCLVMGCGRGPCEVAHTTTGGTGRKADACFTVPLCSTHHRALHDHGVRTFERLHSLDLAQCAAFTERRWQWSRRQPVRVGALVAGVLQRMEEGE